MDNDIIQAYIWQEVIRLGFSPSGSKNIKSWLHQYGKSLPDFWGVENYPKIPKKEKGAVKAQIDCSVNINMELNYSIENIEKFSAEFLHINDTRDLMWTHDVDGKYFKFPNQNFLTKHKQINNAKQECSEIDIERVIDSLLLHPRAHQHILSPVDKHEIRIGGGIDNPFVFLFHLRFQLCPEPIAREEEKVRLINLFFNAIKNKKDINNNELF